MFEFIIKKRVFVIIIAILISVGFGLFLPKITSDSGTDTLLPEGDPDYLYYKEMEKVFGGIDNFIVMVKVKDSIYTKENIKVIDEITNIFEGIKDIDSDDILSLTKIEDMEGRDGELIVESLIDRELINSLDNSQIEKTRDKIRNNPLFKDKIVSKDEKSSIIIAPMKFDPKKQQYLKKYVEDKIKDINNRYSNVETYLSGDPILYATISEYMSRDLGKLFPIAILVVLIMLFIFLRSFFGMIIPLLVTLFSFGLKGMVNSPLTIAETGIPIMLIAIGCADGIHIVNEVFHYLKKGYKIKDAILETMKIMYMPVIMTSLTTGIGALSLLTSPGISLKNMGIFLTFGVIVAMIFSIIFIPAVLSFYKGRKTKLIQESHKKDHFTQIVEKVAHFIIKEKIIVSIIGIIILGLSIVGVINTKVDADELKYFKKTNKLRIATNQIQENMGGIASLDIIIEGKQDDIIKDPKILNAMWELQKFVEKNELVSFSISIADYIKRINYILNDSNPQFDRLPQEVEILSDGEKVEGKNQVAQFMLLYEMGGGDSLKELIDSNYKRARITVRLKDTGHQELRKLMDVIKPYIDKNFPKEADVRFSNRYIELSVSNLIVKSQIFSLITTLIAVLILLTIQFRSIPIGLFTTIPVFVAILFNFAAMWIFGITLNVGTAIIASIGMGIGIDYAIHFFSRFKYIYKENQNYDQSLVLTIMETYKGILFNGLAVGIGFLVLVFSEYYAIASLGWMVSLSMITTALSSLIILPAILATFKPKVK